VAEGSLDDIYAQLAISRVIHVRIANISDELLEKIRKIDGVASAEREIDRVTVHISEDRLSVEDLLDALHALGARIQMFQPEAMDMETVFMKLTEGKTA